MGSPTGGRGPTEREDETERGQCECNERDWVMVQRGRQCSCNNSVTERMGWDALSAAMLGTR